MRFKNFETYFGFCGSSHLCWQR